VCMFCVGVWLVMHVATSRHALCWIGC